MNGMENKLQYLREKVHQFAKKDVFNMNERKLFYRPQLDQYSLVIKQLEGKRLTNVICQNEDSFKKVLLWIIRKYAKLQNFKNVNLSTMNFEYPINKQTRKTETLL